MNFGTTFTGAFNRWLSNLAAARQQLLEPGAARFASLMSPDSSGPTVMLTINSGLHRGASMELTAGEYLIGSGDDCDIVLRDTVISAHHCRLVRHWFGFEVRDLRVEATRPIALQAVRYDSGQVESVYDVGGILLGLRQPPSPQSASSPKQVADLRSRSWLIASIAISVLLLTSAFVAARIRTGTPTTIAIAKRVVAGNQALASQEFGSVRFREGPHGALEIAGLVSDQAQRRRLYEWLKRGNYGDATISVQLMSELLEQARRALAGEHLQIGLLAGRLRIEGTTTQAAVRERVRALKQDLQDSIAVEDDVSYADARKQAASAGPLPIRLRGVMIGDPSYFLTDQGARYFVGGTLPGGAEVLSIDAQQIQFRMADQTIVYKLE
jgi:type III secretion system YscD/HrpQ family protein